MKSSLVPTNLLRSRESASLMVPLMAILLGVTMSLHAVSVGEKSADNSVEAQLEAFRLHEDFEISLFADETMGIANPVAMHWDDRGRLWVLTTLTYAQLEPGEKPNDTLVILEDSDGDGKADKSTVFADGLEMPMGFALGYGGVFLGEGADLLFLKDEDGDDKADTREVLLTGFGTGDTHQNISNFTWGPNGRLYFSQGLHCYSRVETPWGIVRGDTAGFFRYDPETLKLEPFCFPGQASQNPCGIVFDSTGAMFLKSNNRELIYVTPGLVPTTRKKNLVPVASIGATPGKSMGGEYVDSAHLPDWIQNNILIAGYYANRVTAFPLVKDGAGYAPVEPVEVVASDHGSFRPVEIRIGPDGAIYIADWFNPIIGHYQASLRHPDRDEEHGRIWRVTAKGRELNAPADWSVAEGGIVTELPGLPVADTMMDWENPRHRLDGIIAVAQSGDPLGLSIALKALDAPRDRFIDYALEQTVHLLGEDWLAGELKVPEEHTLFVLETLGSPAAIARAWKILERGSVSAEFELGLQQVIAQGGSPQDLLRLLRSDSVSAAMLDRMLKGQVVRRTRPAEGFEEAILGLMQSDESAISAKAVELAGLWGVADAGPYLEALADESQPLEVRKAVAIAGARLMGHEATGLLFDLRKGASVDLKATVIEGLLIIEPRRLMWTMTDDLIGAESIEETVTLLTPILKRKGMPETLGRGLKRRGIEADTAEMLLGALSQMGQNDDELIAVLQDAMGITSGARAYSPDYVAELVSEVSESGDPEAGAEIYQRAVLTCVACHQINNEGGTIGPPLDAVGAGLTTDLLIESVLWPQRQLKEGYFAVSLTTKGGETYSGYREKEENGVYYIRDAATKEVKGIPRVEFSRVENAGSLMPAGLTNGLSREELRDLIAYLASLKG